MPRSSRAKQTPLDRLEEVRQRRVALAHQSDEWSRRRTEAEQALSELPDRRREAMAAEALGQDAEVPSGAGLQATIAEAIERLEAIRSAERELTADEHAIIDANLGFFEARDVQAQGEAGAALERAAESVKAAEAEARAAMAERSTVRRAYIRLGLDPPPEMLASDLAAPLLELNKARQILGQHERAMRNYQQRRATAEAVR
jgi:hypothetical protein